MKIWLIIPPLTQLNTPYPATAFLSGFLREKGFEVAQTDLGIELVSRIFTRSFISKVFDNAESKRLSKRMRRIQKCRFRYEICVEPVVNFLRGNDATLAVRIANRTFLPEGPRFDALADVEWAFGFSGTTDLAKHLATLFLEDLSDFIRETLDSHFDLIRYAEHLSSYAPEFKELEEALSEPLTLIDELMLSILTEFMERESPDLIGFSVPFPGCLYGALRCAQYIKKNCKSMPLVMGGGFVNTELRSISEKHFFDYIDYLILDDGELPLLKLIQFLEGSIPETDLIRTFYVKDNQLIYSGNDTQILPFAESGTPDFTGISLSKYISLSEMVNPMHRLWSCGQWNKMMVAHGCYWAKCAFCDTTLDYICRYDPPSATSVVDKMERIMAQTGQSGFHFVDEALPPKLLKDIAIEILERGLVVSFWGNIRFEKSYTPEFCELLARAGCVAVSGGMEVASNRLLKKMNKGVTVEQVTAAAQNLTEAGIMVHAYLMYGFPTESFQEIVEALGNVRDLFQQGTLQSAFWHRYAMTVHSPSGKDPQTYGIMNVETELHSFCNNEIAYDEDLDYDVEVVGEGLRLATYNFMHDLGYEIPLEEWFSGFIDR